jgi:Bacteriophage Gp15 protein.
MIGALPTSLEVDGVEYLINSDFRAALLVFEAFSDITLTALNKQLVMLEIIYAPPTSSEPNIPPNTAEALKQALWFLDVGVDEKHKKANPVKSMDYSQDEQLLFSAVNAVFARDVREEPYMHWWTFYGLTQAISPDSLISHIVSIRHKRAKHEKLEKHEQKFYFENRHLIDFRTSDEDYENLVAQLRG